MRVLILNQFFYPDYAATSLLMTELADTLVQRGVYVTVATGRGLYRGGKKLPKKDEYKGIHIQRCWTTSFGKGNVLGRLVDYFSFYLGATWGLLRIQKHDVVMSLTTPPLIGCIGLLVGRLRGMRVVALEQDVYPEVAIALGTLKETSVVTRLLRSVSTAVLCRSDRIIALSTCMRQRLRAKVGSASLPPIDVIHNWADGRTIKPSARENWFSNEHDLLKHFVVLFAGNFGKVNDFKTVLEAAHLLKNNGNILFLFVGGGEKAAEIEKFQTKYDLRNIRVLPYHPPSQMADILASAHVSLVTLAKGLAGLSVPSKTYWSLAAGRPVLFVGDLNSDIAQLVTANSCGAAVPSGNSDELAKILSGWESDRARLSELSSAARDLFERRFDLQIAVDSYIDSFKRSLCA
jgi:colanic acid biosynthesis glycosyl transferase WcaI